MTDSIRDHAARLEVVLRAEEDLYLRMKTVLRREESELIGLDPQLLEGTVEEKRTLAEEARLLEESRVLLMADLSESLGLGRERRKLSELLGHLGPDGGDLPAVLGRLSALIESTRSLLEANESFANRSLRGVQKTLRLLGEAVPEEVGYGPGARHASTTGRGRLVRRAI